MPFKTNAARRHRFPKQQYRVTSWAEYDAALRQRGSRTVWFSEEAIAAWRAEPRSTPGGQPRYSALAIRTALTLRAAFRLALRQTEGLIGSILGLLGLDLAVPDHSTLSRRAETLEALGPCPRSPGPVHLLVDGPNVRSKARFLPRSPESDFGVQWRVASPTEVSHDPALHSRVGCVLRFRGLLPCPWPSTA
jgi:Transposase DDE domain